MKLYESRLSYVKIKGGYAISRQNSLELHLGCHTCSLSYFTLVCLWCGRMVARSVYGHVIIKFSRMGRLLHFLNEGAPLARFARKSSTINYWIRISVIYNKYSPKWWWSSLFLAGKYNFLYLFV